ncbi:MAG: hypothetical protein ACRC2R_20950 [Xenococcaceae cyanobacterium]
MFQQMCWLSLEETDTEKILHLRLHAYRSWKPYRDCPEYAVSDYDIPRFPKGLATYYALRRWGWTLVSSTEARMKNFTDEFEELQEGHRSSIDAIESNCLQLPKSELLILDSTTIQF